MVYGITGAGSGLLGRGNLYKPGTMTGTNPMVIAVRRHQARVQHRLEQRRAKRRSDVAAEHRRRILEQDPEFRSGAPRRVFDQLQPAGHEFLHGQLRHEPRPDACRRPRRDDGHPDARAPPAGPVLLRDTGRLVPSPFPDAPNYPITPAVNESIDIHYPDWPVTKTHQYSIGIQRELGKSMALDIRYVGNTNVSGWTTWNMNSPAQWSIYRERVLQRVHEGQGQSPREHRRGQREHLRLHGRAGNRAAADLPGLLRRHPARRRRQSEPGELHLGELQELVLVQQPGDVPEHHQRQRLADDEHRRHGHERPAERDRHGNQSRRQSDQGGPPDQLLHGQPRRRAGWFLPRDKRRQHAVQRDADRVAPADEQRAARPGQLQLRVRAPELFVADAERGLALRPQHRRDPTTPSSSTGSTSCPSARARSGAAARAPG